MFKYKIEIDAKTSEDYKQAYEVIMELISQGVDASTLKTDGFHAGFITQSGEENVVDTSDWFSLTPGNYKHWKVEDGTLYEVLTNKKNIYRGYPMDWGFVPQGNADEDTLEGKGECVVKFRICNEA